MTLFWWQCGAGVRGYGVGFVLFRAAGFVWPRTFFLAGWTSLGRLPLEPGPEMVTWRFPRNGPGFQKSQSSRNPRWVGIQVSGTFSCPRTPGPFWHIHYCCELLLLPVKMGHTHGLGWQQCGCFQVGSRSGVRVAISLVSAQCESMESRWRVTCCPRRLIARANDPRAQCVARCATRHQSSWSSFGSPRLRSSTLEQCARGTPATLDQNPSLCRCAVCLVPSCALGTSCDSFGSAARTSQSVFFRLQRLSTRQGHYHGFWVSNLLVGC